MQTLCAVVICIERLSVIDGYFMFLLLLLFLLIMCARACARYDAMPNTHTHTMNNTIRSQISETPTFQIFEHLFALSLARSLVFALFRLTSSFSLLIFRLFVIFCFFFFLLLSISFNLSFFFFFFFFWQL